ncbi:MAG: septum site-determining protein MinC [Candidatus Gastranaerophilales bacterium]
MEKGYIENGFIVDVSNAAKTSEIIYELSKILDLPDAQSKKVCIKFADIDLNTSDLISINALVKSMNSEIEFISTNSEVTRQSAAKLDLKISNLENKVSVPTYDDNAEKADEISSELEKALDKIFGEDNVSLPNQNDLNNKRPEEISEENEATSNLKTYETIENIIDAEEIETENLKDFNEELETANNSSTTEEINIIKEQLKSTEKLPTLYLQRTLRSGQSLTSDGNVVIIGDVNPGSEIIAKGDITIWGILGGIAHAGSEGNSLARIRALKMNAIQLHIGDIFARRPDNANIPYIQKTDTYTPEEAIVKNKQIFIEKLHNI